MRTLILSLFAGLLVAGSATATTLYTPPAPAAGHLVQCLIQNQGTTTKQVVIDAVDCNGAPSRSSTNWTLLPNEVGFLIDNTDVPTTCACVFRVTGSAKTLRATATYYHDNAGGMVLMAE